MNPKRQIDFKAAEEAAVWLQRLNHEDTPEVRAAFSTWIKQAAANLEEFLFAQAVWKEFDHLDPALAARWAHEGNIDAVVDLPSARSRTNLPTSASSAAARPAGNPPRRRRWSVMGIAAALTIVVLAWQLLPMPKPGMRVYVTTVGDQRAVKLEDGSVMHLNTSSRAEVRYSDSRRTIRLLAGEALFTVEKDPLRPFDVLTDNARIHALGTQFNVYRSSTAATRVTVVDGLVQVSSLGQAARARPPADTPPASLPSGPEPHPVQTIRLAAGDEARIDQDRILKTAMPNVQRAVAWRARQLIFPGNRIADIVAEFNRYSRTPIRVEGEALRERRMSGIFDADDPTPLIEHLSRDPEVIVLRSGGEVVIKPRSAADR